MELEEEELVAPVRPQRITRNMRSGELLKLQRETSKAILSHLIYDTATSASEFNARFPTDTSFFSSQLEVFLLRYAYFSRIFDCSAGWCVR